MLKICLSEITKQNFPERGEDIHVILELIKGNIPKILLKNIFK